MKESEDNDYNFTLQIDEAGGGNQSRYGICEDYGLCEKFYSISIFLERANSIDEKDERRSVIFVAAVGSHEGDE